MKNSVCQKCSSVLAQPCQLELSLENLCYSKLPFEVKAGYKTFSNKLEYRIIQLPILKSTKMVNKILSKTVK